MAKRRNSKGAPGRIHEDPTADPSRAPHEIESSRVSGEHSTYGREWPREVERDRDFGRSRDFGYGTEGRFGAQESYGRESYGPSGMTGRETYEPGYGIEGTSFGGGTWSPNRGREFGSERERWGSSKFNHQIGRETYGSPGTPPTPSYNRESFGGGYGPTTGIYGAEPGAWRAEEGPFRGRGPRGYQRSDARIHEDVCERLTQHGRIDASQIDVSVENGEVTLVGTVDDRQMKRLAEDVAENVSGVTQVHNQIRVGSASETSRPETSSRGPRGRNR